MMEEVHGGGCMVLGGMCGRGHVWQGVCMVERRPLKWAVRIVVECILVLKDMDFISVKCEK